MEVAAAAVSFVGLAGPIVQGLHFLYEFASNARGCPRELKDVQTDISLVESLITLVMQYDIRTERLEKDETLKRAIANARESLRCLKEALQEFGEEEKRARLRGIIFGWKYKNTQRLIESLHRTKTLMVEIKNAVESDIHLETNELSRATTMTVNSIENTMKATDENVKYLREETTETLKVANNIESKVDRLEHMLERLQSPSHLQSEPLSHDAIQRYDSAIALQTPSRAGSDPFSSPSASVISSPVPRSVVSTRSSQNSSVIRRHSTEDFPLLQFRNNTFQFLVARIFCQRNGANKEKLACQRAHSCLQVFPTPATMSRASSERLQPYFENLGLQVTKADQVIAFAKAYLASPPRAGKIQKKPSQSEDLKSEVSHLPQVGEQTIDAWRLYCRVEFYRQARVAIAADAWKGVVTKDYRLQMFKQYLEEEEQSRAEQQSPERLLRGVERLRLTQ